MQYPITTFLNAHRSILLQLLVLLQMIWIVGLPYRSIANDTKRDNSLEIASADSISVRLFINERPQSIKVSPKDGPITFMFDGKQITIEDSSTVIHLQRRGSYLAFSIRDNRYRTKHLRINNSEVSLIRMIEDQAGYRYYRGHMHITSDQQMLKIINKVWLADYVGSVVGSEMNFEHHEALKVQAVIARTYALWNIETSTFDGFDVTDHTMSQVYLGELVKKPRYREAALATTGEIITWSDKLILASFFSTCGGRTVDNESVWDGEPLPYLRAVNDHNACKNSPHFKWDFSILKEELHNIAQAQTGYNISEIGLGESDRFDNVSQIALYTSSSAQPQLVSANKFRLWVIRAVGPRTLKSTRFHFTQPSCNAHYHFEGHGMGHGVGLCQWGALGLSQSGWKYDDIIRFYYKGVEVQDIYEWPSATIDLAR